MQIFANQKIKNAVFFGVLLMFISFMTEEPLLEFLGKSAHRDGQPLPNLAWMYEINWFSFLNLMKASGFVMLIWAVFTGISGIREEKIRWAWMLLGISVNLLIFLVVVANNFIRFYNGLEGFFTFLTVLGFLTLLGSGAWLWWFYMRSESN